MTQATAVSIVALKTFPVFHGLSDEALANIARVAMMRRFPRGQSVVCAGDRPDYVYLVLTGSLKVVVSDEDGREVILSILGQGELFGEMGMFDERPRSASVIAVVLADLVLISKQDFRRIMHDSFDVSWRIMCNLAERLRSGSIDDYSPPERPEQALRTVGESAERAGTAYLHEQNGALTHAYATWDSVFNGRFPRR